MAEYNKALFFKEANIELDSIVAIKNINMFNKWKKKVLLNLDRHYKFRLEKITEPIYKDMWHDNPESIDATIVDEIKLNQIKTILRDMYFKYNIKKQKTKENLEIEKLLKARENNLDFDKELSEMICGELFDMLKKGI